MMFDDNSLIDRFIEWAERKVGYGVTLVLLSLVMFIAGILVPIFVKAIFRVLEGL